MRNALTILLSVLACVSVASESGAVEQSSDVSPGSQGAVQIEIQSPSADFTANEGETTVEVEGIASAIGGVRYLDMVFVMDTSQSLRSTDPQDYRSAGAIGLVRNLSPRSDIKIGVVSFDSKGELAQPMTSDRDMVVQVLRDLPRSGSTNLAAGLRTALRELENNGRPGSSRVIMLFTDGMSNEKKAYEAAVQSQHRGVTIQTLLLGSNTKGTSILDTIAWATGGSFVQVTDPTRLPQAFLDLRTTGVDSVTLSVNGSAPVAAKLAGGTFAGNVPLVVGENRIVALATSLEGQTQESSVTVNVRDASCAALEVAAVKEGRPVISLDERSVEIVVDASRSMWGRMGGEPKMAVAKQILQDVSYWFPEDLNLALRAYGSTSPSDSADCADSTLLVPFGEQNREPIRAAIAGLRPLGQTPIAYALNQAARDFGTLQDDRALVLVTDGLESCGGDPVQAARELREQGIMVHLIGFGLGNAADEDAASLRAVANASGGRYVTASSAEALKEALAHTVATSFSVFKGNTKVANGSLGSDHPLFLPEGDYRVELDSSPPQDVQVSLASRDRVRLTLEKKGGVVSHVERRDRMQHRSCEDVAADIERLEARRETHEPLQTATH
ncbi:MAG: VWA domain-containing protein [Gammaproteobacteria bacterium]|nr:VWA domain-containing protein [Gammaproteobacteria bacterium]